MADPILSLTPQKTASQLRQARDGVCSVLVPGPLNCAGTELQFNKHLSNSAGKSREGSVREPTAEIPHACLQYTGEGLARDWKRSDLDLKRIEKSISTYSTFQIQIPSKFICQKGKEKETQTLALILGKSCILDTLAT